VVGRETKGCIHTRRVLEPVTVRHRRPSIISIRVTSLCLKLPFVLFIVAILGYSVKSYN
jgi:hypothetical protein